MKNNCLSKPEVFNLFDPPLSNIISNGYYNNILTPILAKIFPLVFIQFILIINFKSSCRLEDCGGPKMPR